MRKILRKKPAFTLIEILIALAIFSFALVLVAGIFSSILGNQTLISASSEVTREGQRIMKQMTDDIRDANSLGSVVRINGSYYSRNIEGFLFLDENMKIMDSSELRRYLGSRNLEEISQDEATLNGVAFGMVLFSKSGIKIYYFDRSDDNQQVGDVMYAFVSNVTEVRVDNSNKITNQQGGTNINFVKLNSDKTEVDALIFWGFGCYQNNCDLAPFSQMVFTIRTKDYDQSSSNKRSTFGMKTRVSKRSYAE